MREVIKEAEKEGIKLVDAKSKPPRPRLVADRGKVVPLRATEATENAT